MLFPRGAVLLNHDLIKSRFNFLLKHDLIFAPASEFATQNFAHEQIHVGV
jgi:hypothetical protein